MYYTDKEARIFCEWGAKGIEALIDRVDVFVIVDVLSFSTCVDIAVARGASVHPFAFKDDTAIAYARSIGGTCASPTRSKTELSLSACSLQVIEAGTKLVLPSPNGSQLSKLTHNKPTFAGCLRNASAVALAAQERGERIAIISAGERWPDESIRFSIEDWLGAGAIIKELNGKPSSEAELAASSFASVDDLGSVLSSCSSGMELIERGFPEDVELAAQLNVSTCAPMLVKGAYQNVDSVNLSR